jgi:poly(3-hydroxyalkanoate) synthetase
MPMSAPMMGPAAESARGVDQSAAWRLLAGIAAYRRHPYERRLANPPLIWGTGETEILDYGGVAATPAASGPAVLFVPSLINRAYVLDLAPERSAMRFLAAQGVRPLLLDWGWPGEAERAFTLTDYTMRLEAAMAAVRDRIGGPLVLAGYCMGGLLTIAAAQRRPELVAGLALLATPWDFHAGLDPALVTALSRVEPLLAAAMSNGTLPIDAIQTLFSLLEPGAVGAKYTAFGELDQASDRARMFVALEDWLNDGVPLAAPVALECFRDWYGANTPMRGEWRIAGAPVEPARLRLPVLVAVPARDRIVPPDSAMPLAEMIAGARLVRPAGGHIGMAAGSASETMLWRPLVDWLRGR